MTPTALLMLLMLLTISAKGHYRGPHHPKGSIVKREDHPHHHYVPHQSSPEILTHDKQLLHDKEHLKDDLGEWIFDKGREPTAEEMEFHYFKVHDFDNNSKLDGLEILKALSHILPSSTLDLEDFPDVNENEKGAKRKQERKEDFNYYVELIDKVLAEDDVDDDGYLSYSEYVVGRQQGDKQ